MSLESHVQSMAENARRERFKIIVVGRLVRKANALVVHFDLRLATWEFRLTQMSIYGKKITISDASQQALMLARCRLLKSLSAGLYGRKYVKRAGWYWSDPNKSRRWASKPSRT